MVQMIFFWDDVVSPEDVEFLHVEKGNLAFQSELELLAVLISLVFGMAMM